MNDDLAQLLRSLHLKRIAEILDDEIADAEKVQRTYGDFFARLLRAQWHLRQESALAWRIHHASMPEAWTLESFPFKKQPGVNQRQIRSFAELAFIPKAEKIVFIGPSGVGKNCLAPRAQTRANKMWVLPAGGRSVAAAGPVVPRPSRR